MSNSEEQKGGVPPQGENVPAGKPANVEPPREETVPASSEAASGDFYNEDPYASGAGGSSTPPPQPPAERPKEEQQPDEDDGMLRMSFLEHLEELRARIIRALMGVGIAFFGCLVFSNELWLAVSAPAADALRKLGYDPNLAQITPMDAFTTIWVKLPMLAAVFIASPWILFQVWSFVAPGLYKKERRWAAPFILSAAGLFITGGLFGYFVAFRYGLTFLLGIGKDLNVKPVINLTEYFDLFVNVMLGIGLVFEMPVIIFFLTLLRLASPSFLLRHSRYAILIITIIAAIVTPTPDVFNLMLFAVPMCLLYFVGVFAGYLLVLHREKRRFPWAPFLKWVAIVLAILGIVLYLAMWKFQLHFIAKWPFLGK